jgi:hypothetical protein
MPTSNYGGMSYFIPLQFHFLGTSPSAKAEFKEF